jgi:TRAP-type C4-dicarboxylate transport system substrate-binding protein
MVRVLSGLLAAALLSFAHAPAEAQTTLRVANWLPPSHPLIAKIIRPWTEEVNKATQGRVKMQVLDAPLGPPPAHFDFAVNRVADVTYGVHNYTPGRFVATELPELPFLANKSEHLSVAYWRVHEKYLAKLNEHSGTKVLSVFTHGPGQLFTRKLDLKSIDNIKGAKIRIGGGVAQDVASALGMVPVQVPVTQAYEILSQGVADGIQFPAESVPFFNVHKAVDSGLIVDGGLYNVSFYVVMNQAAWDSLSKEDQDAIMSVSGEKLALKAGQEWDAADTAAYKAMEEAKITIVRPDEKNMSALREKLKPVADAKLKEIGAKGVDANAALAALQEELKKIAGGK